MLTQQPNCSTICLHTNQLPLKHNAATPSVNSKIFAGHCFDFSQKSQRRLTLKWSLCQTRWKFINQQYKWRYSVLPHSNFVCSHHYFNTLYCSTSVPLSFKYIFCNRGSSLLLPNSFHSPLMWTRLILSKRTLLNYETLEFLGLLKSRTETEKICCTGIL